MPDFRKTSLRNSYICEKTKAIFSSTHNHNPYQILTITVLQALYKPNISGRIAKWALELSEYNISFVPFKAIKSQILTDFIIELTPNKQIENNRSRKLFIDGSSAKNKCGAGIVLIDPDDIKLEYAIKLSFQTTNNIAEYEAFIAGLKIVTNLDIKNIEHYKKEGFF